MTQRAHERYPTKKYLWEAIRRIFTEYYLDSWEIFYRGIYEKRKRVDMAVLLAELKPVTMFRICSIQFLKVKNYYDRGKALRLVMPTYLRTSPKYIITHFEKISENCSLDQL